MSFFMTMSTQLVRSNPVTLSSSNLHQQNPFCVSGHGSQWWGSACFCYKLDWQCPDLQTFTLLCTKPIGSNWTFSTKSPGNFWVDTSFTLTWLRNLFDDHSCGCVMTCYNILRQWLLPGETCPGPGMRQGIQGVLVGNCDTKTHASILPTTSHHINIRRWAFLQ